jgi:glycosyltransferase involved in cell wall biosynthesis
VIRYLLDGRSLQGGSAMRGIGTYLRGLLTGFRAVGVADDVGLLLDRSTFVPDTASDGYATYPTRLREVDRRLRPLLDPFRVSMALRGGGPALYHAIEYGQPIRPRIPVVITVHDLVPFVMPGEYSWMRREHALALRQLRRADAVIAVSRSTAIDVERIARVDPSRITVIGEGVAPSVPIHTDRLAEIRRHLRLPDRFVLAVGTFDPRKRIDTLTDVVRRLRRDHDVGLVVAGFQGNYARAVEASIRRAGIDDCSRVLGHVTAEELGALYQMAEHLLFTSAYEGFGLPPLEAMAAGTPVAVFNNSSLPEVVGDAGLVIPDGDSGAMAEAVGRILGDGRERERRRTMGRERAAEFRWDRVAEATVTVYRAVLDLAPTRPRGS